MASTQYDICKKYGAEYIPCLNNSILGISKNVKDNIYPIHGLRHKEEKGTSGWYIWVGDYKEDDDFFVPLHISHIEDWNPIIEKYLALAPGWRFLVTPTYEDVWYDESLIKL